MTTPTYLTGFEGWPSTPTANGTGLIASKDGTPVVDATSKRTGDYGLHLTPTDSVADVVDTPELSSTSYFVLRFYFCFHAWPTSGGSATNIDLVSLVLAGTSDIQVGISMSHEVEIRYGGTLLLGTGTVSLSLDTWYRIDIRLNASSSIWVIDWQINGTAQTQINYNYGSSASGVNIFIGNYYIAATTDCYIDDLVLSATSGDYPIGPGGTERLAPSSDGTHNAGTGVMEDNDGNDIGTVTAYDHVNSSPPSSTTYIKQSAVGTSNYAEVQFANISATHSAILGARGLLAYTSAATQANQGACYMSKDDFSSSTTIHGSSGTRADYSDGSTSNVYYKGAIISGVTDDTTVNALEVRMGHSNDVNPNPYWIDVWVEVAYTTSTGGNYNESASVGAKTLALSSSNLGSLVCSSNIGARTLAIANGTLGTFNHSADLAKALGIGAGTLGTFNHLVDLAKTLAIVMSGGALYLGDINLPKTLAAAAGADLEMEEGLLLAKTLAVGTDVLGEYGHSVDLDKALVVTPSNIGSFQHAADIGARTLAISVSGGFVFFDTATLAKALGISSEVVKSLEDGIALAKALVVTPSSLANLQVTVSLARLGALVSTGTLTLAEAVELARLGTLATSGGVAYYDGTSLAKTLALDSGSQAELLASIGLVKTLALSDQVLGSFNHSVALAKILGISIAAGSSYSEAVALAKALGISGLDEIDVGVVLLTISEKLLTVTTDASVRRYSITLDEEAL